MMLYHGTTVDFERIDLSKSLLGKDFGRGFYLSDNYEQAYALADFKATLYNAHPVVLKFDFDEVALSCGEYRCKFFAGYSKEWAEFVFLNRQNVAEMNTHGYDFVYGPIANDKVGVQVRRLLEGNIDIETFLEKLKFMKGITYQYFFGTKRAISLLRRES